MRGWRVSICYEIYSRNMLVRRWKPLCLQFRWCVWNIQEAWHYLHAGMTSSTYRCTRFQLASTQPLILSNTRFLFFYLISEGHLCLATQSPLSNKNYLHMVIDTSHISRLEQLTFYHWIFRKIYWRHIWTGTVAPLDYTKKSCVLLSKYYIAPPCRSLNTLRPS